MFEMNEVGRKIAIRRKELNMTQMELSDRMGVSFQAVSNWERGNSMPDIAKLPELAEILGLSIDDLLTDPKGDTKGARLVQSIIDGSEKEFVKEEAVDVDTVAELAPILTPGQTETLLADMLESGATEFTLHDLLPLAPFVSDEFLNEWAQNAVSTGNLHDVAALAPFLSTQTLDHLVDGLMDAQVPLSQLSGLAPFLSNAALDKLVAHVIDEDIPLSKVAGLAPFLSNAGLTMLAERALSGKNPSLHGLTGLAPFLPTGMLEGLIKKAMAGKSKQAEDANDVSNE